MKWLIYPFCSVFIVIGCALSAITLRGILHSYAVRGWPTVDAELLSADIESNTGSESATYRVVCEYQYMVDGKKYTGSRIHPGYTGSGGDAHRELHKTLIAAKTFSIYYKPNKPNVSYLLAGPYADQWALFYGGMIFFSAGVFFLLTFHFALFAPNDLAAGLKVLK